MTKPGWLVLGLSVLAFGTTWAVPLHTAVAEPGEFNLTLPHKLQGFFVAACITTGQNIAGNNISYAQTRFYTPDAYTYTIDTTFYVGDGDCRPITSDVLYKTQYTGTINYDGTNRIDKSLSIAKLTFSDSYIALGVNTATFYLAAQLNRDCPCNGTFAPGEARNISALDCGATDTTYAVCQIISGKTDYFNFKFENNYQYVTSSDCFDSMPDCLNNPVNPTQLRQSVPYSGNTDPNRCTYDLWAKYSIPIEQAANNCEGCTGLECDGCLFRELNPDWEPSLSDPNNFVWTEPCPCIYRYAEKYEKAWLQTYC